MDESTEEINSELRPALKKVKSKWSRDRQFLTSFHNQEHPTSPPKNNHREMFGTDGFTERRDLEQYFWTTRTINDILNALKFTFGADASCCLCTPSLAHTWWVEQNEVVNLLDIDTRFDYLPGFRYFDLRFPVESGSMSLKPEEQESWRVIVFDPPFFYIPMQTLYEAVIYVCDGKVASTKLLLGFLKREEKVLLSTFREFNLKETNFKLEYAHVKPNKWVNYSMYSNVDLPGIKRKT